MKKKQTAGIIAISLVAILLSLVLEIIVFNWDYFAQGGSKQEDITEFTTNNLDLLENGKYLILENDASIKLNNINDYVSELEFNTSTFKTNVDVRISYNGKVIHNNIALINKKSIVIGEKVQNISISFINAKNQEIYIDDFQNVNHLQINPFRVMMILLFMMLVGVFGFSFYKRGNVRLEVVFLIFVMSFGFANTTMIPVLYGYDDAEHFVKSYNLAEGNIIMEEEEVISYPVGMGEFLSKKYDTANPNYRTYEEFQLGNNSLLDLNYANSEMEYYQSTAITYTAVPYLFSAMGILVSKLINSSFIISYYLGRFFNLLMYAIVVFFAIKTIPMAKKLMFVCALLPTVLFQVTSFSADVTILGFGFLVFSIVIKCVVDRKRISIFDIMIILSCFIIITASKATYAPIFLIVLLLRKDNFSNSRKEWLIKLGILFIGGLTFIGVYLYGQKLGLTPWGIEGVNVKEQLLFIVLNPIQYIGVMWKTFVIKYDVLLGASTVYLAYIGDLAKSAGIVSWTMLIFLAFFDNDSKSSQLVMRDRGFIFLMCLLTLVISMTALYATFTPVGNEMVLGFQGRYLIPLIFPCLFMLQKKKWFIYTNEKVVNGMAIVFSGSLLYYSASYIFNLYYI